jgi:hypothetical protein
MPQQGGSDSLSSHSSLAGLRHALLHVVCWAGNAAPRPSLLVIKPTTNPASPATADHPNPTTGRWNRVFVNQQAPSDASALRHSFSAARESTDAAARSLAGWFRPATPMDEAAERGGSPLAGRRLASSEVSGGHSFAGTPNSVAGLARKSFSAVWSALGLAGGGGHGTTHDHPAAAHRFQGSRMSTGDTSYLGGSFWTGAGSASTERASPALSMVAQAPGAAVLLPPPAQPPPPGRVELPPRRPSSGGAGRGGSGAISFLVHGPSGTAAIRPSRLSSLRSSAAVGEGGDEGTHQLQLQPAGGPRGERIRQSAAALRSISLGRGAMAAAALEPPLLAGIGAPATRLAGAFPNTAAAAAAAVERSSHSYTEPSPRVRSAARAAGPLGEGLEPTEAGAPDPWDQWALHGQAAASSSGMACAKPEPTRFPRVPALSAEGEAWHAGLEEVSPRSTGSADSPTGPSLDAMYAGLVTGRVGRAGRSSSVDAAAPLPPRPQNGEERWRGFDLGEWAGLCCVLYGATVPSGRWALGEPE